MIKKTFLLGTILLLAINDIRGQTFGSFDSLIINKVIEVKSKDLLVSEFPEGPELTIFFSIENKTDSIVLIKNPYSHPILPHYEYIPFLSIEYKINGRSKETEIIYGWSDDDLSIPPHTKQTFEVGLDLALPYNDYSNEFLTIIDHSQQLYERLPSLRLIVRISENKIFSLTPQSITQGDWFINFLKY